MRYFTNTRFEGEPTISRIERFLPVIATHLELKTMNYFTLEVEWLASFDIAAGVEEELTVTLYFAEFSQVSLKVDGSTVLETGLN